MVLLVNYRKPQGRSEMLIKDINGMIIEARIMYLQQNTIFISCSLSKTIIRLFWIQIVRIQTKKNAEIKTKSIKI